MGFERVIPHCAGCLRLLVTFLLQKGHGRALLQGIPDFAMLLMLVRFDLGMIRCPEST